MMQVPALSLDNVQWDSLNEQIHTQKFTPIVSSSLFNKHLPGQDNLLSSWAKYIGYPQTSNLDITHLIRFTSLKVRSNEKAIESFLNFFTHHLYDLLVEADEALEDFHGNISDIAQRYGLPKYAEENPIQLLAQMPLPIYLTTSHHKFLEQALVQAGKMPRSDVCFWREGRQIAADEKKRVNRRNLADLLAKSFSLEELDDLCFDLDTSIEEITPNVPLKSVVRELIRYAERESKIGQMVTLAMEHKPNSQWDDVWLNAGQRKQSSIFDKDPDYKISSEEPLVYHLFGLEDHPETLVLTEDDYFDFLINLSWTNKRIIPPKIREVLADTSLIMLGYDMYSWDFKVLFQGLIASKRRVQDSRAGLSIAIQIEKEEGQALSQLTQFHSYLNDYFLHKANFSIYWGTPEQFMQGLGQRR